MVRLIFIHSLTHSGSTALDRAISRYPGAVGLGEVGVALETYVRNPAFLDELQPCTCGRRYNECHYWAELFASLPPSQECTMDDAYRLAVEVFESVFGSDAVMIDSSKKSHNLLQAVATGADVRIINLFRDVRAWTVSQQRVAHRFGIERRLLSRAGLRGRISTTTPFLMVRWYRMNTLLREAAQSTARPVMDVSYEDFATSPAELLSAVSQFAELNAEQHESAAESHILFGSLMRHNSSLADRVVYDVRWLADGSWVLWSLLLRRVMHLNAELVYSGTGLETRWDPANAAASD